MFTKTTTTASNYYRQSYNIAGQVAEKNDTQIAEPVAVSGAHNDQPQRIAFVGTEVRVMLGFRGELMKELVAKGHQVYAFAIDYTHECEQTIRRMGFIPVQYSLKGYSLNPLSELRAFWQLYRAFKQHQISMSFCYFAKPAIYGTLAAWVARVPQRVAKIEGLGRTFTEGVNKPVLRMRIARQVQSWLFRLALPRSTALIVLNHDDQKDLQRYCKVDLPNTVVLGGIGVCLEQFSPSPVPTKPLTFTFIGRLLNEKGIRYFLDVAERIKARNPEVRFLVVGAATADYGVSQSELNYYIERGIIEHPGQVDNVVPYIECSSVFVLPSYYREGLPRSTQEALAIGRPVITTNAPGCRDTVDEGINGYLVPRHDVDALEQAMQRMIDHAPDTLESMGRASRQMAEQRFNVREVNQRLIKLLNL